MSEKVTKKNARRIARHIAAMMLERQVGMGIDACDDDQENELIVEEIRQLIVELETPHRRVLERNYKTAHKWQRPTA